MIARISAAILIALGLTAAQAASIDGEQSYGLLFKQGTLDSFEKSNSLVYQRDVVSALKPEAEERDTGKIVISFQDNETIANLQFRKDEKHRGLGVFPASVGNPMIMYFYETVVRDMAEAAGGSPFYIRNRVKDALVQPSEMETGQAIFDGKTIETTTINLYPFSEDPNRGRMHGFGNLVLSITMSDEVPGWYLSLIAEATNNSETVYRSMVVLEGIEVSQ